MENTAVVNNRMVEIPLEVCRKLNVQDGDKITFVDNDGQIIVTNTNILVWKEFREAMRGAAEEAGFKNDDDVVEYCMEVRRKRWKELNEGNV